ncbi:MAG: YcxB family protein [Spirochaetes bacterium]|nr:YcxB family protein [Spirochaetota bacterium]
MKLEVSGLLDFKNYLKLTYYLIYKKKGIILATLASVMTFIIYIYDFINPESVIESGQYVFFILSIFILFGFPVLFYFQSKNYYKSNSFINEKIKYIIDENEIVAVTDTNNYSTIWNNINKVIILKNWIMIFTTNTSSFPLHKSFFHEWQFNELKIFIKENYRSKIKKF